ncbi:hypothetical protein VPFG_00237 [Vibrio phage nt-1]|uniref:Uncharacterized protein n=1 Tax=Vibrio phage nt-1 TaxID=115992 RepID=R9TEN9_9CAUD|nr:hypothetical protein VPFG_00237 [Vibrio phage nt-1]AGN30236.1 hypothetical protein VPFG_00237 [Vibrio phage nt-1]
MYDLMAAKARKILSDSDFMTNEHEFSCLAIAGYVERNSDMRYRDASAAVKELGASFVYQVLKDDVFMLGFELSDYARAKIAYEVDQFVHDIASSSEDNIDPELFLRARKSWLEFVIENGEVQ